MKKPIGISMTEGAPWRHTVRFAIPVLAGALLQQLYSTVDMMIVGRFTGKIAFINIILSLYLRFSAYSRGRDTPSCRWRSSSAHWACAFS